MQRRTAHYEADVFAWAQEHYEANLLYAMRAIFAGLPLGMQRSGRTWKIGRRGNALSSWRRPGTASSRRQTTAVRPVGKA